MKVLTRFTAVATLASLAACASSPEVDALYQAGWRRAQVIDFYDTSRAAEPVAKDCRRDPAARSYSRSALTTEDAGAALSTRGKRIVPVSDQLDVRAGNVVFIHPTDCGQSLKRA